MALTKSQLLADAAEIKEEVIPSANTALRVGAMLENIIKSTTKPYDSTASYKAGQYVFFNSAAWRALSNIAIGESPSLAPTKWKAQDKPTLDALITDASAQFVDALPAVPGPDPTAPGNNIIGFGLLYKKPDGSLGIKRMLGNDAWAYLARQATESELQFFARTKVRPFLSVSALLRDNPFVDQTPYLTGRDANLFFHKYKSEGDWTDRGLVFLEQDGTQNLFRSIIGFTGLYNFFQIDGVRQLKAYYDRVMVEVDLKAKGNVLAQSFSTSSIPIAQRVDYVAVGQTNASGGIDIVYTTPAKLQAALGQTATQFGSVKAVKCQTVNVAAPTVTRWQRLTPAMLNTQLAHPLETAGSNIIVSMRGVDNRPEDLLSYDFPDAAHVRFYLPNGVTDYPGGSYKLETIQS